MALIECKECGKQISDKATTCPHCGKIVVENPNLQLCKECMAEIPTDATTCPSCGCPVNEKNSILSSNTQNKKENILKKRWGWCVLILAIIFIIIISGSDKNKEKNNKNDSDTIEASNTVETTAETKTLEEITPATAVDFYKWIDENDPSMDYVIPEMALTFIEEHPEFFPGNDKNTGAMSDYVDYEITYQHIAKSPSKYNDKLISINGTIVDCYENECEYGTLTFIQIMDDYTGDSYCLYYWGSLENTFENQWTWGYALPFDIVTFENVGGYYTEAIVGAACYISEETETY